MPDKQHHTPTGELSYYGLSLLSYLKDSHPELIAESEFIAERADSAAQAYSERSVRAATTSRPKKLPARNSAADCTFHPTTRW